MRNKLEPDETIGSVLHDLSDADGYVRRVYAIMHSNKHIRDRLSVRIGVQGTGQKPYFRIVLDAVEGTEDRDEQIIGAYYDNGDPLKTSSSTNGNWSTAATSYAEVGDILQRWMDQRSRERAERK
jgi:hypothetical protein